MAGTYSQMYVMIVFAVKGRKNSIESNWEDRLHQYITGIIREKRQKLITIGGTSNHIHIFIGLNAGCHLPDLVREIKKSSTAFIQANHLSRFKFYWQEGYGAFSYSRSQIPTVSNYVLNQNEHHKKITFKEEYLAFLKKYEIEYDEKYLFEWYDGTSGIDMPKASKVCSKRCGG